MLGWFVYFFSCTGFDNEEVCERELPKSIGCSKNFRGPDMLDTRAKVGASSNFVSMGVNPFVESDFLS